METKQNTGYPQPYTQPQQQPYPHPQSQQVPMYPNPHMQQQVIIHPIHVGPDPVRAVCPSCHANMETTVSYEPTGKTHIMAALLCLFGCWPCVCVPYCVDSCQNANHYCPSCNAFIGTYSS